MTTAYTVDYPTDPDCRAKFDNMRFLPVECKWPSGSFDDGTILPLGVFRYMAGDGIEDEVDYKESAPDSQEADLAALPQLAYLNVKVTRVWEDGKQVFPKADELIAIGYRAKEIVFIEGLNLAGEIDEEAEAREAVISALEYAVEIMGRKLARAVVDQFLAEHGAELDKMVAACFGTEPDAKPAITGLDVIAPETRYRGLGFCDE